MWEKWEKWEKLLSMIMEPLQVIGIELLGDLECRAQMSEYPALLIPSRMQGEVLSQ